jgi:hypothetical protein
MEAFKVAVDLLSQLHHHFLKLPHVFKFGFVILLVLFVKLHSTHVDAIVEVKLAELTLHVVDDQFV